MQKKMNIYYGFKKQLLCMLLTTGIPVMLLLLLTSAVFAKPHNAPPTAYSIFNSVGTPASNGNDGTGIEVGMKFQTTQDGLITGIRYYKQSGITGTRKGHIWTATGTMLVEATFSNETTSGWQELIFSSPVSVKGNTTYIVSYHSSSGDYVYSSNYFTSAVTSGPLKALADGEDGGNGLYSYSATSVAPTSTYNASNYWVDAIFMPGTIGSVFDGTANYVTKFTTPKSIANSLIYDNGTGVGIGTTTPGTYKLAVNGVVGARKLKVTQETWADYVFDKDYKLPTLEEVERFIKKNKHLPGVPSSADIIANGLDVGGNQEVLLKKIEELTLYLLLVNKELNELKKQKNEIAELKATIYELKKKLDKVE